MWEIEKWASWSRYSQGWRFHQIVIHCLKGIQDYTLLGEVQNIWTKLFEKRIKLQIVSNLMANIT